MTLSQKLNITAAVIVTTPQELSFVDVERGIEMFDSVNVPCVAVVENMAYIELDGSSKDGMNDEAEKGLLNEKTMKNAFISKLTESGAVMDDIDQVAQGLVQVVLEEQQKQLDSFPEVRKEDEKEQLRIFGPGHKARLAGQWGIENTFSMPLMENIASNGDSGTPFILDSPDSPQADIYRELASSVVREVVKVQYAQKNSRPVINYNEKKHILDILTVDEDGKTMSNTLEPAELRRECKCAACVEELSGRQILQPSDVSDDIKPIKMGPTGNYALSVDWSDGHRSLYPYRQIHSLIQSRTESKDKTTEKESVAA